MSIFDTNLPLQDQKPHQDQYLQTELNQVSLSPMRKFGPEQAEDLSKQPLKKLKSL